MQVENCGCDSTGGGTGGISNVSIEGLNGISVTANGQDFQVDGKSLLDGIEKKQDKLTNTLDLVNPNDGGDSVKSIANDTESAVRAASTYYEVDAIADNSSAHYEVISKKNFADSANLRVDDSKSEFNLQHSKYSRAFLRGNLGKEYFDFSLGINNGTLINKITSSPNVLTAWKNYLGIGHRYYLFYQNIINGITCDVVDLADVVMVTIYGTVTEPIKQINNRIVLLDLSKTIIRRENTAFKLHPITFLTPDGKWTHIDLRWDGKNIGAYIEGYSEIPAGYSTVFEQTFTFIKV